MSKKEINCIKAIHCKSLKNYQTLINLLYKNGYTLDSENKDIYHNDLYEKGYQVILFDKNNPNLFLSKLDDYPNWNTKETMIKKVLYEDFKESLELNRV